MQISCASYELRQQFYDKGLPSYEMRSLVPLQFVLTELMCCAFTFSAVRILLQRQFLFGSHIIFRLFSVLLFPFALLHGCDCGVGVELAFCLNRQTSN